MVKPWFTQIYACWESKKKTLCLHSNTLIVFMLSTHPLHVYICTGLQASEGVHHCPGTNEVHLSRLLEDGLWERVWCDCDAVRPGGEWRGWENWAYRLPILLFSLKTTFISQEVCYQYWPADDTKGVQKYGEFTVSVLQATKQDGFVQRSISITNPKVLEKSGRLIMKKWIGIVQTGIVCALHIASFLDFDCLQIWLLPVCMQIQRGKGRPESSCHMQWCHECQVERR